MARSIVFSPAREGAIVADQHGRTPFDNSSLASLDNFNATLPHNLVSVEKLARFAVDVGLDKVLRWKPRMVGLFLLSGPEPEANLVVCSPKTFKPRASISS